MLNKLLVKLTAPFIFPWLLHFFSTTIITMIIKLISKWKYKILDWSLCQSHWQIILLTSPPIHKYILTICIASHSESYEDSDKNCVVLSIISMRLIYLIAFSKKSSEISRMGVTISIKLIKEQRIGKWITCPKTQLSNDARDSNTYFNLFLSVGMIRY